MPKLDRCRTHPHPPASDAEQSEMYIALASAMTEVGVLYALANRTPAYHYLTEDLGRISAELIRIGRNP